MCGRKQHFKGVTELGGDYYLVKNLYKMVMDADSNERALILCGETICDVNGV